MGSELLWQGGCGSSSRSASSPARRTWPLSQPPHFSPSLSQWELPFPPPHPPEGRAYLSRWVEPEGSVAVRVDWSLWEGFALTTHASLNSRVHMEGVQE